MKTLKSSARDSSVGIELDRVASNPIAATTGGVTKQNYKHDSDDEM